MTHTSHRFGIAWFPNGNPHSECFYVAGTLGGSVDNAFALPSDIIWFTNLSFEAMRDAGIAAAPHLRGDRYLRWPLTHLADDLGLLNTPTHTLTRTLYAIVNEALQLLSDAIGDRIPLGPYGLANHIDVPCAPRAAKENRDYIDILANAVQITHAMSGVRAPRGSKIARLRTSRLAHYYFALRETILPAGPFKEMSVPASYQNMSSARARAYWQNILETKDKAVLVRLSVKSLDPFVARFFSPGHVSGNTQNNVRSWFPLDEALLLSHVATVSVGGALAAPAARDNGTGIVECLDILAHGGISTSASLAAHILVGAVCGQRDDTVTSIGPFVAAADRCLLARLAAHLANQGRVIGSMGAGSVSVFAQNPAFSLNDAAELCANALATGLMPAKSLLDKIGDVQTQPAKLNTDPLPGAPGYSAMLRQSEEINRPTIDGEAI
ncbi:MAG: hypothetical protein D6712_20450 [Chloroflexi bacterium]|nr:MAG: hypothetical protein D6712_20450 [Chloroflexota bacterium]